MNIGRLIRDHATLFPDRPALIEGSGLQRKVLTFADMDQQTAQGSSFLHSNRHEYGECILFMQPVSIKLYVGLLSVMRAGLNAAFIDPSQSRAFLNSVIKMYPPHAFYGDGKARFARLVYPALGRIPRYDHRALTKSVSVPSKEPKTPPIDNASLITFTSGSTGQPKRIIRTHQFLGAQHRALEKAIDLEGGEIDLITLPMFVLANIASGLTSVLADMDFAQPGMGVLASCTQAQESGATRVAASPAFFESMLGSNTDFPKLEKIYTGGAPVSPQLLESLGQAFPDAKVSAVYGSSEAEPIAVLDSREISKEDMKKMKEGSGLLAGIPVPDISCSIIPENEKLPDLDNEPMKSGEICVSGEHVLDSYHDDAEDHQHKIQVKDKIWHRTGDAGYFDGYGRLWLLGRCGAAFTDKGGKLRYPLEIEIPVNAIPFVHRSAVIIHHDRPTLFVELEKGIKTSNEISESILGCVPERAVSEIRFIDKIPVDRRHNAKINYQALQES